MNPFPTITENIAEAELARTSGLARGDLKKKREGLEFGVDWLGGDGAAIVYTPCGLAKLQVLLAADEKNGTGAALGEAASAAEAGAGYVMLIVERVASQRVLLAKKEGLDGPVRLLVRSSLNFVPGMSLDRCQASDNPLVYFYHGRQPRRKGRL